MAKDIVVSHVRDVALGKRTYHYLLSGLVRNSPKFSNSLFIVKVFATIFRGKNSNKIKFRTLHFILSGKAN